jgi:hypothetical protein
MGKVSGRTPHHESLSTPGQARRREYGGSSSLITSLQVRRWSARDLGVSGTTVTLGRESPALGWIGRLRSLPARTSGAACSGAHSVAMEGLVILDRERVEALVGPAQDQESVDCGRSGERSPFPHTSANVPHTSANVPHTSANARAVSRPPRSPAARAGDAGVEARCKPDKAGQEEASVHRRTDGIPTATGQARLHLPCWRLPGRERRGKYRAPPLYRASVDDGDSPNAAR